MGEENNNGTEQKKRRTRRPSIFIVIDDEGKVCSPIGGFKSEKAAIESLAGASGAFDIACIHRQITVTPVTISKVSNRKG